jgi:hypothetical protein
MACGTCCLAVPGSAPRSSTRSGTYPPAVCRHPPTLFFAHARSSKGTWIDYHLWPNGRTAEACPSHRSTEAPRCGMAPRPRSVSAAPPQRRHRQQHPRHRGGVGAAASGTIGRPDERGVGAAEPPAAHRPPAAGGVRDIDSRGTRACIICVHAVMRMTRMVMTMTMTMMLGLRMLMMIMTTTNDDAKTITASDWR